MLRIRDDDARSDAVLMAAFVRRDPQAAAVLYDRFASRIYGLGVVMLGDDRAAEDLVQDTFVKLWRSSARFDPTKGKLETWVLLAARSLAIDAIRRRVAEARALEAVREPGATDPSPSPDELVVVADMGDRARRAIACLSPEQRSALELAYFGGRTTAEVAALEGIPHGTAKTRIRAAILRLREEMAKEVDRDL